MLNNKELSLKDPTDKDFAASSLPEKAGAHLGSAWLWVCLLARGAACAHGCALQCMPECAGGLDVHRACTCTVAMCGAAGCPDRALMGVCTLIGVCTNAHHLYSASFCCLAFAGPRIALKSFQVHCRPEQPTLEHLSHSEQLSHASPKAGALQLQSSTSGEPSEGETQPQTQPWPPCHRPQGHSRELAWQPAEHQLSQEKVTHENQQHQGTNISCRA